MKSEINFNGYDTLLQPTDWRYAASVVGLVKYLDYHKLDYKLLYDLDLTPENAIYGFDGVLYNKADLTEELYLDFAESYFHSDMTHKSILSILEEEEFDDEKIKFVQKLLNCNEIKDICGELHFDGTNKENIISLLVEKRYELIKRKYWFSPKLYGNHNGNKPKNEGKRIIFRESLPSCRLTGYSVDKGKKSNSLGFCFCNKSFTANDIPEFDFIPFSFSNADMKEMFFVNNNYSVKSLLSTSQWFSDELKKLEDKDARNNLYWVLRNANKYIDYDVEIIAKNIDEEFYKTLYVRSERLKALRCLKENELNFLYKINDYWLNLEREVSNRCIKGLVLDDLILLMIKISLKALNDKKQKISIKKINWFTQNLIFIDQLWKGNDNMSDKEITKKNQKNMEFIESAKKMGFIVSQELIKQGKSNKVNTYKQKLIGALTAHDYDRVNEILLNLSSYVEMEFSFFYTLLEDPEENKNIALAFTSALIADNYNDNN